MTLDTLLLPFFWILNGLLALIYLLAGQWLAVLLVIPLGRLIWVAPPEQRIWTAVAGGLGVFASLFAPQPVPFWMLLMATSGALAVSAEQFNPDNLRWRVVSGLSLYALAGLGFAIFQWYLEHQAQENLLLAQGQTYIGILIGVAMYGIPLGFLVLLAQALWAHPPLPGQPAQIIHTLRARGRD